MNKIESQPRSGQKRLGFEQNRTMSKIVFQILSNRESFCRKSCFWDAVNRFPEHKNFMSQPRLLGR
ncbi:hypothetical protein CD116_10035 [Staphylococcus schweitzeri]|uniref:Uncharacterized protein n=1 Tax=Staphylococcus schweitzeri TaxID=1654388 RepID=A0A2K4AFY5_9STAP|nr:hypothetical protein CD116_10035 [Staphylococcus schweitzeri]CDR27625.1 hypothetical protein ERS140147_00732 [Staphylococcus schweitzeri]CDR51208.1 hypothetical protein ERS140159_01155 [Staphylococcus schweitzeri]CDR53845.1 hypothetical protein ERS140266_01161 [Staphylococcus schweitzeri]CDR61002.1 hypothetical protein ERS140239_00812 [Staphylococcus schweitzeri]